MQIAEESSGNRGIRVGDRLVYVSHRPARSGDAQALLPLHARFKVHSVSLGDHTRLVTLIIHPRGADDLGLEETVVSTREGGQGRMLARGLSHCGQPVILVFRLESPALSRLPA